MEHHLTNVLITVIALGVFSQWLAWFTRAPAIVLFLLMGLLAGPVAFGLVEPSRDFGPLFRPAVSLAVAVILFEGGLNLRFHELREAASGVKRLVSLGALFSWVLCAVAAHNIGGLSAPVSLLFGAIMVVTGPTVIIPMLRQAGLNRRSASYLKWEGIINDPIGALLTVLVFEYFVLTGEGAAADLVFIDLGWAVLISLLLGAGGGYAMGRVFRRAWVPEYLKAPMTLALILVVYGLANQTFDEAGLLAVTVMGMVMGNMQLPSLEEMRRFKEYITILMVSTVFILLTAELDVDILTRLDWRIGALVLAVMFLVRPISIMLATMFTDMQWRDRLLLSWIAPRGIVAAAVAGIFGPRMEELGFEGAELLLPLVFAVVFATVVAHGLSIGWLARRLRLSADPHGVLVVGASPWTTELARMLTNELGVNTYLVDSSWHRLREARLAGVKVIYGEVLSDQVQESLELNEIACLLAATSNDAYNALVCSNFVNHLEHDRVFQLPMYGGDEPDQSKLLSRPLRGIPAFEDGAEYEELWRRHYQSWKFYKTKITENYSHEDFLRDCPAGTMPVAVLREDGILLFHAPSQPIKPGPGDTVIYYASGKREVDEARQEARAAKTEAATQRGWENAEPQTDG